MSVRTSKQRYEQLMEWLPTLKSNRKVKAKKSKSRLEYYDSKGINSGRDSRQGNRRR